MELPSISIITACLNAEAGIEEALASVLSQGYPKLELFVVDGGSTDRTLQLVEAAGVRYMSEPDEGRPDALNKGIAATSGDVVGFLNGDDFYLPGALQAVGEALAAQPDTAWATGECRIVDGDGREIRRPVQRYKNFFLRHFSFPLYLTHNFVSDPATFVRRTALDEAGPLDVAYPISHDYDLWLRVARRHPRPLVLRRELAAFRMAPGSLSMEGFRRQFREHAEVAARHGEGHRLSVAANRVISRGIVGTYQVLRALRHARER